MNKVEVKPLPIQKWHGKKNQESFARPKTIQAFADPSTMKYIHGLTDEDLKELKKKLGAKYDLSDDFNPETAHPFWDSSQARIKLENNTQIFNKANALDLIKVGIIKACPYVANSFEEWEEGRWPNATHYIYDEKETDEHEASKVELRDRAILEAQKLGKDRKLQIAYMMLGRNLKNNSDNALIVAIDKCISTDPKTFLKHASKENANMVALGAMVKEAIDASILRKEGHKIMYMDSVLGVEELEVAEYFDKPENNELKLHILDKLSS